MSKRRISRSSHVDNLILSHKALPENDTHLFIKHPSDSYQQNNHNSSSIQHEQIIETMTNENHPRKRGRRTFSHRSQSLSSSTLLLVIRLMIFLILCFIVYYTFIALYPKPKQTNWERFWFSIMNQ